VRYLKHHAEDFRRHTAQWNLTRHLAQDCRSKPLLDAPHVVLPLSDGISSLNDLDGSKAADFLGSAQ